MLSGEACANEFKLSIIFIIFCVLFISFFALGYLLNVGDFCFLPSPFSAILKLLSMSEDRRDLGALSSVLMPS